MQTLAPVVPAEQDFAQLAFDISTRMHPADIYDYLVKYRSEEDDPWHTCHTAMDLRIELMVDITITGAQVFCERIAARDAEGEDE